MFFITYVLNSEEIRKIFTVPKPEKITSLPQKKKTKHNKGEKTGLLRNNSESWKRRFLFSFFFFSIWHLLSEIHATMVLSFFKWGCDKRILKKSEEHKRPFVHRVFRIFDEIVTFEFWSSFGPSGPLPTGSKGPPQRNILFAFYYQTQIHHQGKLNNIEESFYNFCQRTAS